MSTPIGASQWMYSSGEFDIGQSVKFNDDDSQYLSWTPTSAGNRKTWTWAGWVKRGNISIDMPLFVQRNGTETSFIRFTSGDLIQYYARNSSSTNLANYTSGSAVYRDASAWYHLVVAQDTTQATASDRVKIYVNGESISLTAVTTVSQNTDTFINTAQDHFIGYWAEDSDYADGYLADVYFIDGTALDPTSFGETVDGYWKAKDASGLTFGSNGWHLNFKDDIVSEGFNTVTYTGTGAAQSISGLGLENGADLVWLKERTDADAHLLFDSVRGPNKKIYSNLANAEYITMSNELMSFDADGFSLGASGNVTTNGNKMVGWCWDAGANNAATGHSSVDFYATAGSAGKVRGLGFTPDLVWTKARNTTQSHQLFDSVRGDNNILYSNLTNAESAQSAGYFTLEPDGFNYGTSTFSSNKYIAWAWDAGTGSAASNTDGDITSTVKASDTHGFSIGTFTKGSGTQTVGHGLSTAPDWLIVKRYSGGTGSWAVYHSANTANPETDYLRINSTNGTADDATFWGDTAPTSSVFSVGSAFNSGEDLLFYAWSAKSGYSDFGSYTGTAASQTITTNFRPGFVMFKRTDTTGNWFIVDTTRNPFNSVDLRLYPNLTNADSAADSINVTDTGFEIVGTFSDINASGGTYVYMAFKGSYSDYVSDFNTDGSIDSRVKANPSYGFSIVNYTATGSGDITVGHGLGVTPSLIIGKTRNQAYDWRVFHTDLGGTKQLALNSNAAAATANAWGQTNPTSTVFTAGRGGNENLNYASGDTVVCYCFAEVSGYSKISSYTGTGSANNAVTGLGFSPSFVMLKRTDSTGAWLMFDNTRADGPGPGNNGGTSTVKYLQANASNNENTSSTISMSFDSDGFTVGTSNTDINASGGNYAYYAVADTREYSFWKDVSDNGNHWTPNNLDYRDSLPDTPNNNFATMNTTIGPHGCTVQEGNLYVTVPDNKSIGSTFAVDSGKWYVEFYADSSSYVSAGIVGDSQAFGANLNGSSVAYMYSYVGTVYKEGTGDTTPGSFTSGDVIGFYVDLDNNKLYIYKNGAGITTSEGTHTVGSLGISITDRNYYFGATSNGNNAQVIFNFGQDSTFSGAKAPGSYTDANGIGSFQYEPPSSYLALCTSNLPTPTIIDGTEHFNTVLYTGDNADRNIDVGFKSDFVWLKHRNGASAHRLYDSVRGDGQTLFSNLTNAEYDGVDDGVDFTYADGFNIDAGLNVASYNGSGSTYATWNWKAGGTAVSNTSGSITSSVSANSTAGFSIITYTGNGTAGATIGHGLSSAPEFLAIHSRDTAQSWLNYDAPNGGTKYMALQSTQASSASSDRFNNTDPTSSVITLGTHVACNTNAEDYVCYAWHSVDGYQKVGSYTGNGSNQFVYTGFRPALLLVKRSSNASGWYVFDNERGPYNPNKLNLSPNSSAAESTASGGVHFLSNGFEETGFINDSGQTVIYLAIAETPFKYATAR